MVCMCVACTCVCVLAGMHALAAALRLHVQIQMQTTYARVCSTYLKGAEAEAGHFQAVVHRYQRHLGHGLASIASMASLSVFGWWEMSVILGTMGRG